MSMHQLRGITWDHPRGLDPLLATAAEFSRQHEDVDITWTARSLQAFADQPMAELASDYDLIVIDHPHVGEVAATGSLIALDEHLEADELRSLSARSIGESHDTYQWDGRQWALAIDAAAQVAAYRPDLLGTPPTTWPEVVALAEEGRVLWPLKPVDSASSFFSLCANLGRPVATDESALVEEDVAHHVLDAMTEVARCLPAECLSMNPIQVLDLLAQSEQFAYAPLLYGYTNYSRNGFRSHLVGFADIPALGDAGPRGSMLGGAGLAVSSRCDAVPAAVNYARYVASGEVQRTTYVEAGGQPAHADAWDDHHANELCHDFFRSTRATMDASWIRPRYNGYLDVQARTGEVITEHLRGGLDREKAITEANEAYRSSTPVLDGNG